MRIIATTTLADLAVELAKYSLRAAAEMHGPTNRFEVTLTDPNGVTAVGTGFELHDAFDAALERYRQLSGIVTATIVARPETIVYAPLKEIPPQIIFDPRRTCARCRTHLDVPGGCPQCVPGKELRGIV